MCFNCHGNLLADTPELPLPIVSLNTVYLPVSVGFTVALNINLHADAKKAEEDKCDTSMVNNHA